MSNIALHNLSNTIYVGNLDYNIEEDVIETMFEHLGCILDIKLIRDPQTDRSRGYCFISFETLDAAETAINTLNGQIIEGSSRALRVSSPRKKLATQDDAEEVHAAAPRTARRSRHAFQRNYFLRNFTPPPINQTPGVAS